MASELFKQALSQIKPETVVFVKEYLDSLERKMMDKNYVIKYDNHDAGQFQYLEYFCYNDEWAYFFCQNDTDALKFSQEDSELMVNFFKSLFPKMRIFAVLIGES